MKKDLRDDHDVIKELAKAKEKPITHEEGEELSKEINAECYLDFTRGRCFSESSRNCI